MIGKKRHRAGWPFDFEDMALKCPSCGKYAEDGRFYCASCGAELQQTHRADDKGSRQPLQEVHDVDSRALTLILTGISVCIAAFIAYGFGLFLNPEFQPFYAGHWEDWPYPILFAGLCMIGVGLYLNWSQGLPRAVRFSASIEIISAIVGFAVVVAVIMDVTSWQGVFDSAGRLHGQVPVYGNRILGFLLLWPFVFCPIFWVVVDRRLRSKLAWLAGVVLSIATVLLVLLIVVGGLGTTIAILLAGLQIVFLASMTFVARGWSATRHKSELSKMRVFD